MKKIILVFSIFFLVFFIYYFNMDKKIYIFSLGDYFVLGDNGNIYQSYLDDYYGKKIEDNVIFGNNGDYRIIDLINDIKNNREFKYNGKKYTLNNCLVKADLIIISIGINDLRFNSSNNNYDYIDEVLNDLIDLLSLIRKYSKEKVFIFNYFDVYNNVLNNYVNKKLKNIVKKFNIEIIDISHINSLGLDKIDYNNISEKIINNFTKLKKQYIIKLGGDYYGYE